MQTTQNVIYKATGVCKYFQGVVALENVNMDVYQGEILAIVGENGAGKSTLMNILSGVFPPTKGTLEYDGSPVEFQSPRQAQEKGIAMIHQELSLSGALSIAENIFQARLPLNRFGIVNRAKLMQDSKTLLQEVGLGYLDPRKKVREISTSQQQQVEIAKAFSLNAKFLILDEPTSSLTPSEAKILHQLMLSLKEKGITMLYISHKLDEIMEISDRIAVFRDGEYVDTLTTKETNIQKVISLMVGREYDTVYTRKKYFTNYDTGEKLMQVKNLSVGNKVQNVSFDLYKGEVLGITGLVGAGRSEVLQAIYGADPPDEGQVKVKGEIVSTKHPRHTIASGMGLVPEGRKTQGVLHKFCVAKNMSIMHLRHLCTSSFIHKKKEKHMVDDYCRKLRVKTPSPSQKIMNLSGGNQQKAIMARCLMNRPDIILLDEPTQGIDIGAKNEIYDIIDDLAGQGVGVVVVSSEMPETIGLCDRVVVMHEGKVNGELLHKDMNEVTLMQLMAGQQV